jgi:hypothetical protein
LQPLQAEPFHPPINRATTSGAESRFHQGRLEVSRLVVAPILEIKFAGIGLPMALYDSYGKRIRAPATVQS